VKNEEDHRAQGGGRQDKLHRDRLREQLDHLI
jgi:hypothetical protein